MRAKIRLTVGGNTQSIETTNVRGMYSTSENIVHFGVGPARQIARLEIEWPDGTKDIANDVPTNNVITLSREGSAANHDSPSINTLLNEITDEVALPYRHRENIFDDYRSQVLIPHKQSQNGPAAAVADVNGDGRDDLYLGGASGQAGELYLQMEDDQFTASSVETFRSASLLEDVAAEFFDADSDGDPDLYVVSGGNEWEADSPFYQDRLYLNDGEGQFSVAPAGSLPTLTASGGCISPADFDGDGDLDLFVGGRLKPQDYPAPANSYLLRNDGGIFTDVTAELAPFLNNFGLVTAAEWTDLNADGKPDLMVVGEWMSITQLLNQGDRFERKALTAANNTSTTGWWFSLTKTDLDGDGDEDFVFGNLGQNYKYQTSPAEPFEVFYEDFDDNGKRDIVLSYYNDGKQFPLRGRSCSAQQIPELKQSFPSYDAFAGATLTEVFDPFALDGALSLSAASFSSMVGINDGGSIRLQQLPAEAQFSPVRTSIVKDVNKDGRADIILAGNLYQSEVETPRADAGMGLVLLRTKDGRFEPQPASVSGLSVRSDARQILVLDGDRILVVANDGKVRVYAGQE